MADPDNPWHKQAVDLLERTYAPADNTILVEVIPGRVNLIGEHIDYHLLPVLPIAINRSVVIAYCATPRQEVRAISNYGRRATVVRLGPQTAHPAGDWTNYISAAVDVVCKNWTVTRGFDAALVSDLPIAAGLSSSSAVMIAFVIALLRVNGIAPELGPLMAILPEAEHFVGTRGGGMDHAAIVASHAGCALHLHFSPLEYRHVPIPEDWRFLVAHSLSTAEKSGELREKYNRLKAAGLRGLAEEGHSSFHGVSLKGFTGVGDGAVFEHVVREAERVEHAVGTLQTGNLEVFGDLLLASHASMRDKLEVSTPAIDALVQAAMDAGAAGARLTGAGFGGCVLVACRRQSSVAVRERLLERYYAKQTGFDAAQHLFFVEPSSGALIDK